MYFIDFWWTIKSNKKLSGPLKQKSLNFRPPIGKNEEYILYISHCLMFFNLGNMTTLYGSISVYSFSKQPSRTSIQDALKLSNGVWLYMRPISYVDIVEWLYRQVLMTFLEFNPNNHTLPLAYNSCFSFGNHHVPVEIVCVFVCVTMKTHKSYRSDPLFQAHAVCMFGKRLTG